MNFGLSTTDYEKFLTTVVQPLKKLGLVVYIFGSRATGKHHPFSDIDVMYVNESKSTFSFEILNIKEAIEESNFPIKVDLVNWNDLAESYKPNVLKNRILI